MTSRDVLPIATKAGSSGRVAADPLGAARFLAVQLIDDLENRRSACERELGAAEERLVALRDQLADAQALRSHVLSHVHRLTVADVDQAFSRATGLVAEVAALEVDRRCGIARARELGTTADGLRATLRCLDDVAAGGETGTDAVAGHRAASRHVFQILEEDRLRMARDMHDGPAQAMANFVLSVEVLERLYERDPSRVQEDLAGLKDDARSALAETRRLLFDLRPMSLDDLGMVVTLRRLVDEFRERTQLVATLHVAGEERRLPRNLEAALFRIVQEALGNAGRHARAQRVDVVLTLGEQRASALVRDDGEGFDVAATEARQGRTRNLGLISMRERAELEHGRLDIRSEIGRGTEVRVTFDL